MPILGKNQRPPGGLFSAGRHYIFQVRQNAVAIEDIFIAASLLCRGYQYNSGRIEREFVPGTFNGTDLGRLTATGEKVFLFIIQGDESEFTLRKRLIHRGAHLIDASEFKMQRSRLLDALSDARRTAEAMEREEKKRAEDAGDGRG